MPTNHIITRARVTPIPITPGVITHVNTIATQEDMPRGLQITNKSGITLYDSAWIAGVDFEDSDYDSDSDLEDYDGEDYIRGVHIGEYKLSWVQLAGKVRDKPKTARKIAL